MNPRTLQRRLAKWEFIKYSERIPSTILPTLQARGIYLFHQHIVSDKEILVVLDNEGYIQLTMRQLQHLRLLLGMSRRLIAGNSITENIKIHVLL